MSCHGNVNKNATPGSVYVAEVQAVGLTLKNEVKEACLVNFQTSAAPGSDYYLVIDWTATCRDAGNGKTVVTLVVRVRATRMWLFRHRRCEQAIP